MRTTDLAEPRAVPPSGSSDSSPSGPGRSAGVASIVAPVVPRPLAAAGALAAVAAVAFLPGSLSGGAQLALFVLGAAMVAWTLTGLDETKVAVAAAAALVLGG